MKTTNSKSGKLRQLLIIDSCCPYIETLNELPDSVGFIREFYSARMKYQLKHRFYESNYPGSETATIWRKIRDVYAIAFDEFQEEVEQKLGTLVDKQADRIAYLKRLFDELYSGQDYTNSKGQVAKFLRSEKFESLKSQIGDELWNDLKEMGYAVWESDVVSRATSIFIERQLQIEGVPVKYGYLWREPTEPEVSTPPPSDPVQKIVIETDGEQGKLSHPAIAILYHINGWLITDNNADTIAKKFGHISGQRLKTEYKNLAEEDVRTGEGKNRVNNYKNIEKLILAKYKDQYDKELAKCIKNNKK